MKMRLLSALLLLPLPAMAGSEATGDALRAALVGNSVTGSMLASGGYAEFYAPDGTIRGADYDGHWSIKGNKMCFAYGGDPENCWAAVINGASVSWLGAGGEEGSGKITPGNPNGW